MEKYFSNNMIRNSLFSIKDQEECFIETKFS